jgi:hypothetical protein
MCPRYCSYADCHPLVEQSLSIRHQVVGNNGQRQAMFLELEIVFQHDDGGL